MVSLPQSAQATLKKFLAIGVNSLVNQFELLSSLAWCIMRLAGLRATEENVHSLGWLFTAVRLRTWETTVSSHNAAETALTPAKFGGASLLNALNGVHGMLASRRTVALDLSGSLYHM